MLALLTQNSRLNGLEFDDSYKIFFFGAWVADIENFRFLIGDKIIIGKLVTHVRELNESDPLHFKVPQNYRMSRHNTVQLPAGRFFGQHSLNMDAPQQFENIKEDLFNKVKEAMQTIIDTVPIVRPISQDIIQVTKAGNRIRGDVVCVFCPINKIENKKPKVFSVQAFTPNRSSSVYWTIANFKRHLRSHCSPENKIEVVPEEHFENNENVDHVVDHDKNHNNSVPSKTCDDNDELMDIIELSIETIESDENDKNADCSVSGDVKIEALDDIENDIIYMQISDQIIEISKSVIVNNEFTEKMCFLIGKEEKEVEVVKIPGNGSCLFASIVHQVFNISISAEEEKFVEKTNDIRAQVVSYIDENFSRFALALRGRIWDREDEIKKRKPKKKGKSKKKITDEEVDEKCRKFLKDELSQPSCWGGHESLAAVSELLKINILVFQENGLVYFPNSFNPMYTRTVCLAYRLAGIPKKIKTNTISVYNHYDSIFGIESSVIFTCSQSLCGKKKSDEMNDRDLIIPD